MSEPLMQQLQQFSEMVKHGLMTKKEFEEQKQRILLQLGRSSGSSSGLHLRQLGSYRILSMIGKGGMGIAYRARHRTDAMAKKQGGNVAIKVMHAQHASNPLFVERFEREAALSMKLEHPGIVKVHDLIMDNQQIGLVMEEVVGMPMSQMIGNMTGPIPWEQTQPLFKQILLAVGHAHQHDVIHRDIKPENIMVTEDKKIKILDFGIAKEVDSSKTRTGTGLGTIEYMAPEQYIDSKSVDSRSDIYALGMTLYEMLAGRLPWENSTAPFEIMRLKADQELPSPRVFYPEIPLHVVDAIQQATKKDKEHRFSTVQQFLHALENPPKRIAPLKISAPPQRVLTPRSQNLHETSEQLTSLPPPKPHAPLLPNVIEEWTPPKIQKNTNEKTKESKNQLQHRPQGLPKSPAPHIPRSVEPPAEQGEMPYGMLILLGALGSVMITIIFIAGWLYLDSEDSQPKVVEPTKETVVSVTAASVSQNRTESDSNLKPNRPVKKQKPKKKKVKTSEKVEKTASPNQRKGGTMRVQVSGGSALGITLSGCGKTQRGGVPATFRNVPNERCTLRFSPSGATTRITGGNKTVKCVLTSGASSVSCR